VISRFPDLSPLHLAADPKGCCARLYESDAVRWLLDGQLHPGGDRLTLRLARLAGVARGQRVLDVACGSGGTVLLLARALDCMAVGVDLGARAIEQATDAARRAQLEGRASFVLGDAEALPLADAGFDVALSECSLCTFPSKRRAVAEMARVVRPGGTIAIADVTANLDALPPPLRSAAARVACVADACSADEYAALLRDAGCELLAIEPHDAELAAIADRVEARLRIARMLAAPGEQRERVAEASSLAHMAIDAIASGTLGYALIAARRLGWSLGRAGAEQGHGSRGSPDGSQKTEVPSGRTTSQTPPNSSTLWQSTRPGASST
jgi:arsenite methyltransferase